MPAGRGDPDRHLEDLAAELGGARQLRRAAGQDDPGRQHPDAARPGSRSRSSSNVSRIRASMICAHLEPADRPAGVLAEDARR